MTNKETMLVLLSSGGRYGNQLMAFSHLIALAEEYPEFKILNVSFWEYSALAEGTVDQARCAYPATARSPWFLPSWLPKARAVIAPKSSRHILNRGYRFFLSQIAPKLMPSKTITCNGSRMPALGSEQFLERIRKRDYFFLNGFDFRDWELLAKHQSKVREFLRPPKRFSHPAHQFIDEKRRNHKELIGVLVRQDDYRVWGDGDFFYSSAQYRTFLEQLSKRFGADAGFVIATDEAQDPKCFEGLPAYWCTGEKAGPNHYLESMVELSLCDIIVSVPSTFSAWAAFFGNKPILPLGRGEQSLLETPLLADHLFGARLHPTFCLSVR